MSFSQLETIGPYEVVARIATGGMAEVFLARRTGPHGFEKYVAVKRILPELAFEPDYVAMFVDEARIGARLQHPNVVQVFDFGVDHGVPFIVLELVRGSTAAHLLRAVKPRPVDGVLPARPALPVAAALHVALSLLHALGYAHDLHDERGNPLDLVHRDVSPANVLFDCAGGVKLTDFGIVRFSEMERRTLTGEVKGKFGYMSPEQVIGEELDSRSDIFNVGILLSEMLLGEPLFAGFVGVDMLTRVRDADIRIIDKSDGRVPDGLRSILHRALACRRADRFPTAAAFAAGLGEFALNEGVLPGPDALLASLLQHRLIPGTSAGRRGTSLMPAPQPASAAFGVPVSPSLSPQFRDATDLAALRTRATGDPVVAVRPSDPAPIFDRVTVRPK